MNTLEARRRLLGRNVYKRTTEGNPAIAQGSLARMYPGITMQGWTEQDSTTGKNLSYLEIGAYSAINTDKVDSDTRARIFEPLSPTGDIVISIATGFQMFSRKFKENTLVQELGWNAGPVKISKEDTFDAITVVVRKTDDSNWSSEDLSKTNFQIEYGTSATAYEPYTGGQPSPSPDYPQPIASAGKYNEETGKYQYEVKLTGGNLFNPDAEFVTGLYSGVPVNNKGTVSIKLYKKDSEADVSGCYLGLSGNGINGEFGIGWALSNGNLINNGQVINNKPNRYVTWYPPGKSTLQKILNKYDIMINDGSNPLPFQPYKKQTVTLTSDRPLTKWGKLEKRNGQWGWVYKSAEIVLDGSEDEAWILVQTDSYNQFYINIDTVEHLSNQKNAYCKEFRPAVIADRETEKEIIYTVRGISGAIAVSTELATELDVWKTWLQSNPITVLYRSIEETFVPLTESEQEAMNAIYTFRPTTVLSNDCDCSMSLTYKTKKSMQSALGGGIRKPSKVTSYFTFGVKWSDINKIILKISGVTEGQNMLLCPKNKQGIYIAISANANETDYIHPSLNGFVANVIPNEVLDGGYHEVTFTFDTPTENSEVINVWDAQWSKNIIYHEIMFYDGDNLLADYVPYYKGAGYMLDKKNNVVIRASDPDVYQFA